MAIFKAPFRFRIIIRDAPKDQEHYTAGRNAFQQGHLNLAIDTMKKLADIEPDNMTTRVRLAQMACSGDKKQALS